MNSLQQTGQTYSLVARQGGAQRHPPNSSAVEMQHGMPLLVDQLIAMLRAEEHASQPMSHGRNTRATKPGQAGTEMGVSATRRGRELMQRGYTVEQVVRDYGDLCQEITGLAMERDVPIKVDEFRTLNRCLDDGIADAVTEFACQRDALMAGSGVEGIVTLNSVGRRDATRGRFVPVMQHAERVSPAARC